MSLKDRPGINLNLNIFVCMFLILFSAKVFGFITISWWWVVLPLIIPMAIFVGVLSLVAIVFLITVARDKW